MHAISIIECLLYSSTYVKHRNKEINEHGVIYSMTEEQSIFRELKKRSFLVLKNQETFSEEVMFSRMRICWPWENGGRGISGSKDSRCKGKGRVLRDQELK